jgi:hypothetical protein
MGKFKKQNLYISIKIEFILFFLYVENIHVVGDIKTAYNLYLQDTFAQLIWY